jgi:AcrR family transcriptional regulator
MPELPTTARGTATSRRILAAAADEFAERGIAGARIERIIAAASSNKAQLYGYFGSKDGLFDAVMAEQRDRLMSAVPMDPRDMPGWAVGMYDANLRHPQLIRLMTWLRLERRPNGRLSDGAEDGPKLAAIAQTQAAGHLCRCDPSDLIAMVIAMACAWSPASGYYAATADDPEAEHERRREMLRECVRRAVTA